MAYKIIHAKKELKGLVLGQYVNIQKPDTYDGAVYKFDTTLTGPLAEKLALAIDTNLATGCGEMGCKPSPNKRPYKRQDDGSIIFTFKIKEFTEGERPFKLWDMKMKAIVDVPNLTGGTILNVNFAFYISEYKGTGFIALQPTHCQVQHAEIYEGNGSSGPTFGGGEGYESEEGSPNFDESVPPREPAQDDDF
jgi:hypothetical protein